MEERFWEKVDKTGECWLFTGAISNRGYGQIGTPGRSKHITAHRYSAMLHYGMFDRRTVVMHTCDVTRCVRPEHLVLGSQSEDMADMVSKGRWKDRERVNPGKCGKCGEPWSKPKSRCRPCDIAADRARRAA
jgi:hypothetical protein